MPDRLFSDVELAALYDLFNPPGARDDFAFYLPMIAPARAVLDVGCGTGAMLHMARDAGHKGRLVGLDPARGMIEQARRRPDIEWVEGDLRSVSFARAFDLIVMTGHAFQVLVGDDDIRDTLAAIRAALTEDGCFAFETRNPLARAWEHWARGYSREITDDAGVLVRMSTSVDEPFDGRVVSFSHTFTSPRWASAQISHSTLRFLGRNELAVFLDGAGFAIEAQFGDWDRSPVSAASPEIITLARPRER
ncbi:MAG: methyltransferase domain-containing protein [Alphaproteobacteria bacterium]|nr:methyltransferase domain-containing protein [Alphaproteobacteria bacterium]